MKLVKIANDKYDKLQELRLKIWRKKGKHIRFSDLLEVKKLEEVE